MDNEKVGPCCTCIHYCTNGAIYCDARSVRWGIDMEPRWWCYEALGKDDIIKPYKPYHMRDKEKEAILREYYPIESVEEVAERTGMTVNAVYMAANRLGLKKKNV